MIKQLSFLISPSLKLEFAWCPPGGFIDHDKSYTFTKGFWLGRTPITNGQWMEIMGNGHMKNIEDNYPVCRLDYNEVITFIKALNKLVRANIYGEKIEFDLPNIAEMEYAARAGADKKWFWGDDENEMVNYAWVRENSNNHLHKVATKNLINGAFMIYMGMSWKCVMKC